MRSPEPALGSILAQVWALSPEPAREFVFGEEMGCPCFYYSPNPAGSEEDEAPDGDVVGVTSEFIPKIVDPYDPASADIA